MDRLPALLFLLLISVSPLVPAWIWFRMKKYGSLRFMLSVLAGLLSVIIAGIIQLILSPDLNSQVQMRDIIFGVFVRVSLIEESSRAIVLFALFHFIPYSRIILNKNKPDEPQAAVNPAQFFGAPSGLVAGLGFAAVENIFYGIGNPGAVYLRFFTAFLHGACGARIGSALSLFREQPVIAASQFIAAVLIHGIYNICILNPGVPWFLSAFIALSAFMSSVMSIYFNDPNFSIKK